MNKYLLSLIILIGSIDLAFADKVVIKPYQAGDWSTIANGTNGVPPIAIHFWGVTCPACVKEMPLWGNFLKSNPSAKVIFIQVDDVNLESMQLMLTKAGLQNANNFYVAGPFDERLRYEIDPKWHGETPTTFLMYKNGKLVRKTGLVNFQKLQNSIKAAS